MIETYLLEHLAAFKKCKTLSGAAAYLHLTQPTLTRSMNRLEELFGVSLFTREKKRLYLNENGLMAAKYAENILDLQNKMFLRVRALDRQAKTITVGSCAPGPLMELMPLLSRTFSQMTVSTEIKDEEELSRGLRNGTYQMIILNRPVNGTDYHCVRCSSEQLYASLMPAHPMAGRSFVSFKDLNGENFLMAAEVGMWDKIVRQYLPESKFFLQDGTEALLEVSENSTLPGFATDLTLRVLGKRAGRVHIPFADPESRAEFFCVCNEPDLPKYKKWFDLLGQRTSG